MRAKAVVVLALMVGGAIGYGVSQSQIHMTTYTRLNANLYQFSEELHFAESASTQFGKNSSTHLGLAYVNNYKLYVAQAYALWLSMSPDLLQEGIPSTDIDQIREFLQTTYNNILPPFGMDENSQTVVKARYWISMFANALPTEINHDYVSALKENIAKIVQTYRSFSSDGNFQVTPCCY